jgi:hypothetical protein
VAITQRVKEGKWYNVYNRRKRLVGTWQIFESRNRKGKVTGEGWWYKGFVYDQNMRIVWDLTGDNGLYPTAIEAAQAAIANVQHPN